jgi:hypothetical protein
MGKSTIYLDFQVPTRATYCPVPAYFQLFLQQIDKADSLRLLMP